MKTLATVGLDENFEMTGGGRLVGMVIDGKHTPFSADPIQRDDPHAAKANQLQHADVENWLGDNYTKVVFEGSEREVLTLYGSLVEVTIELNNQDLDFGLLGQNAPNSNSFNAEMKEKLGQIGGHLGIAIGDHDASGWDIGKKLDLATVDAKLYAWQPIDDMRARVDQLERTAAQQLQTLKAEGIDTDLNTAIPKAPRAPSL
ncbi:hypothetical protein [Arvimicrobium flavum]|uniref:hypothetical protein n=1 Tax=Arvimicrobium flavum TaxID=3393320 RepID=UPI00237C13FE|nr:hypothetical protein [Mesorhizobium shangrilense]